MYMHIYIYMYTYILPFSLITPSNVLGVRGASTPPACARNPSPTREEKEKTKTTLIKVSLECKVNQRYEHMSRWVFGTCLRGSLERIRSICIFWSFGNKNAKPLSSFAQNLKTQKQYHLCHG